jgi:DNA-directed RNA polymerase sigma subunit (sigma70/sigma32)
VKLQLLNSCLMYIMKPCNATQAVSRSVVDEGTVVRLPLNVYDLARRIRRISLDIAESGARYGNKPTAEEVAAAVKLPAEKVQKILQVCFAWALWVCFSLAV